MKDLWLAIKDIHVHGPRELRIGMYWLIAGISMVTLALISFFIVSILSSGFLVLLSYVCLVISRKFFNKHERQLELGMMDELSRRRTSVKDLNPWR